MFGVSLINYHNIILATLSRFFSNIQSLDSSNNKKVKAPLDSESKSAGPSLFASFNT